MLGFIISDGWLINGLNNWNTVDRHWQRKNNINLNDAHFWINLSFIRVFFQFHLHSCWHISSILECKRSKTKCEHWWSWLLNVRLPLKNLHWQIWWTSWLEVDYDNIRNHTEHESNGLNQRYLISKDSDAHYR